MICSIHFSKVYYGILGLHIAYSEHININIKALVKSLTIVEKLSNLLHVAPMKLLASTLAQRAWDQAPI